MLNQKQTLTLTVVVFCLLASIVFAEAPATAGTISKVTVYRGQALVTRTININLPEGTTELIVKDLPPKIVPESIYSQSLDGTKVLSVRYLVPFLKN